MPCILECETPSVNCSGSLKSLTFIEDFFGNLSMLLHREAHFLPSFCFM